MLVRTVASSCDLCQKSKYYNKNVEGKRYFDIPRGPKQLVALDIFGPITSTQFGMKYIIVFQDIFTEYTKLYSIKSITAKTICNVTRNKYIQEEGTPKKFLTDLGRQFISREWNTLQNKVDCELIFTTLYNHQSNPVERTMKEIGRILRAYCHKNQASWLQYLQAMEQTINSTYHSSTKMIPYELENKCDVIITMGKKTNYTNKIPLKQKLQIAYKKLIQPSDKRNKIQESKVKAVECTRGQKVLKREHQLSSKLKKISSKLCLLRYGPYTVNKIVRKNAHELENQNGKIIGKYNARQLRPFKEAPKLN